MKKEIRNRWIVAVLGIIFLLMAFISEGQNKMSLSRVANYDETGIKPITTIYPTDAMEFTSPAKIEDDIYLSIRADSMGNGIYGITLYSYVPLILANYKPIHILFDDGSIGEFLPIKLEYNDVNPGNVTHGYTKYQVRSQSLKLLIKQKIKDRY